MVNEEELYHDSEVLYLQYVTGNLELDLLRISDHLIQCSKLIWHDTEIRMLNLLALGGELIREELQGEQMCARFYGTKVSAISDRSFSLESDSGIGLGFVSLKALTSHSAVFGAMLSFMQGCPEEGIIQTKNPVRCVAERTLFVQKTFKRFQAEGLSRACAIETAVIAAKVLSIRRSTGFEEKILADEIVMKALEKVRGCIVEESTGMDIADVVSLGNEEDVDHYGADSTLLHPVENQNLNGGSFQLLDYTTNCHKLYGKLEVHESAVEFPNEGRKHIAYCREKRVHVRKKGLNETLRKRFGGDKIGLTLFGTGMQIELKEAAPLYSDNEAMDLIMSKAKTRSKLGRWVWSKIMKGQIDYKKTEDSCMWNKYARNSNASLHGQWSVPKWVLRHMLVMVKDGNDRDKILVQAGNSMPVFEIQDKGLTRYSCRHVDSARVKRDYRKAFFRPIMSAGGEAHLPRAGEDRSVLQFDELSNA